MTLQLALEEIAPRTQNTSIQVLLDNTTIISPDNKIYPITINDSKQSAISLVIKDPSKPNDTIITLPLRIIQKDILGKLKSFPDSVGTSPFEVTLDATTTTLSDTEDEIIYFSRDFGDGQKTPNSSQ